MFSVCLLWYGNKCPSSSFMLFFRNNILEGAFRGILRTTFNPKRLLSVRFAGEMGMDGGGLTREFLRLSMMAIAECDIFFGKNHEKYLNYSAKGVYFMYMLQLLYVFTQIKLVIQTVIFYIKSQNMRLIIRCVQIIILIYILAFDAKQYMAAGRLMAYSLVHGGQMPNFLAKPLFQYLAGQEVTWPLESVPSAFRGQILSVS